MPAMADSSDSRFSTPYLLGGAAVLYVVYHIALALRDSARIRKLGARAPVRRSYAPWGIDIAYDVLSHALRDETYQVWLKMFNKWAGPGRYTIEAGIGERVILTAEPENIKAILATQFKDYGKGEGFRRDWHSFLGNGTWAVESLSACVYVCSADMDVQASSPRMAIFGTTLAS
jgi:hypothetical protein